MNFLSTPLLDSHKVGLAQKFNSTEEADNTNHVREISALM